MTDALPIVIFVGVSAPLSVACSGGEPPLALQGGGEGGRLFADQWWDAIVAAGWNVPSNIYVTTNASYYKYFEHWGFGKGVHVSHIINSGRTLGDSRVDWTTLGVALRLIQRDQASSSSPTSTSHPQPRDVVVIALDSSPSTSYVGKNFVQFFHKLTKAPSSAVFLQSRSSDNNATTSSVGGGPLVTANATQVQDSELLKVSSITSSTTTAAAAAAAAYTVPLVFCIKGADVASISTPQHATPAAGTAAITSSNSNNHAVIESVSPLESVMAFLCSSSSSTSSSTSGVSGIVLPEAFTVGTNDGRAHGATTFSFLSSTSSLSGGDNIAPILLGAVSSTPYMHKLPEGVPASSSATTTTTTVSSSSPPSSTSTTASPSSVLIHTRAHARVGLLGNPSDGYGGKTLAVTIANFAAETWLFPSPDKSAGITLIPHPIFDPLYFPNLRHLSTVAGREGYSGGIRLMMAALHRFSLHCEKHGVTLPERGFVARYHTTVPRQVGLAGSSAILTAFLRAVMKFYGYGDEASASSIGLSRDTLPGFVLSIETEELGITAGLQDRVVQAYEGCVHMNFDPHGIKEKGHGTYTRVPVSALPPLFLAYCADPSDSGRIHAPVKQRWLAGDPEVVGGMKLIGSLADEAFAVASARPYNSSARSIHQSSGAGASSSATAGASSRNTYKEKEAIVGEWAKLMATNFNTRRSLFGDPALGKDNIRMIEIARECGSSGKFPGSGGAIVGVVDVAGMEAKGTIPPVSSRSSSMASSEGKSEEQIAADRVATATDVLRAAYHKEGYVFIRLQPHETITV